HQWQLNGVPISALDARIHARYGVFSPVRSEYVDLVAEAPMPPVPGGAEAMDLGTGTGVLAAVLARRGAAHVLATDINPRAVACAQENIRRLGLEGRVTVLEADLLPPGRADLVVCNPPWLPGAATSALELGIYDDASSMLRGFLDGLPAHLRPGGEAWLILSDLAEHLQLRSRQELKRMIEGAGLEVLGRLGRGTASRLTTAPEALREPRRLLLRSHGLTSTDVRKPRCGRGHVEKGRSGLTGVCGARNVLPRAPEIGTSGRTVIRTGMPALTRHARPSE